MLALTVNYQDQQTGVRVEVGGCDLQQNVTFYFRKCLLTYL